jgi:hypothetical protein
MVGDSDTGPAAETRRPTVFVAYAYDSAEHERDVLRLCQLLIRNGVEIRVDKWALRERRGWGEWTGAEISRADYVLAIASEALRRAGNGAAAAYESRGAQAETALLRELLQQDRPTWRRKILPVLLPGRCWTEIPAFLNPCNDTWFPIKDFTLAGAESLIRLLTAQPAHVPPERGAPPYLPPYDPDDATAAGPLSPPAGAFQNTNVAGAGSAMSQQNGINCGTFHADAPRTGER